MSSYRVEIDAEAWDALMKLPTREADRIFVIIEKLELEPRPSGVVKLADEDCAYRVRSGNYRVVYDVYDDVLIVRVVKVAKRGDVYRKRR
jgi:mRNA interferase RelE/StbE